ncbi:hypothetical protein MES4922_170067 [Mesorhizobium ventifaucium]|uniref:Uncharacterized protein n=1 Tax=Mesorhizobium ventifaucium TaxID=666020 RepID=A0ABN8JGJ4_9HYPH|nr:hypothetical protein MES4922_170067 [Mesorhizobium ventifaucium]
MDTILKQQGETGGINPLPKLDQRSGGPMSMDGMGQDPARAIASGLRCPSLPCRAFLPVQ